MIKIATSIDDIEDLMPVALEWKKTCNGSQFGIDLLPVVHFADLASLVERDDADLFLLLNEKNKVIGYMGITSFNSPLGDQKIVQEHYWYVSGNNRGHGTMLLIRAAKEWAKEHGCSHIIFNASNLASGMHDKLCKFYERIGFKKFETSYIKEIT